MSEKRFRIIFRGKVAQGHRVEEVKRNLASLFKLNDERIEQLFSGKPIVVAKSADYESAMKYKMAFETAGAICRVEEFKNKIQMAWQLGIEKEKASKLDQPETITCPKCGHEQEETEECEKCGVFITKYTTKYTPKYTEKEEETPQDTPEHETSPLFFSVSMPKLVLMSLFTLGLYEVYWFYKNWKLIQLRTGQNIRPFWRGLFAIFFCHALFKSVQESSESCKGQWDISPGWLAFGYIALGVLWKLPDPFWLISLLTFLPLLPVQRAINDINAKSVPGAEPDSNYSLKNIIAMVIGGTCLALAVIGTSVESPFDKNHNKNGRLEWKELTSIEGSFSISFPGNPQKEVQQVDIQTGKLDQPVFSVTSKNGRVTYLVSYVDYPQAAMLDVDPYQVLNNVRDGMVDSYGGEVTNETDLQLDFHPGREFSFKSTVENQRISCYARIFLVSQRLYQLMVLGEEADVEMQDVNRFFISFALL